MATSDTFDAVILGGGAAGLMCAAEAGRGGTRVLVLEHNDRCGRKILISGGGRCNFTNVNTTAANFLSGNAHFAKSALARYTPADFLKLVAKHRIPYHEKKLGQLFCDRSATDILAMLEAECRAGGVSIRTSTRVAGVRHEAGTFAIETDRGAVESRALVVATGGLSIPKIGATDFGYRLAKQFGHRIVPTRPALVPLLVPGFADLAGVAAEVTATANRQTFRERLLFTHRGISGPAILQISSYLPGELAIDFEPEGAEGLPRRLARAWDERVLERRRWLPDVRGTEGFEKAEVTLGGVDTRDVSSKTMESRLTRGLYFIGEVLDVTGHLGGYNFQWAWSSAHAAALSINGGDS